MRDIADRIGANRGVLALSVGRLGDAVGNSILFIVIPLYIAKLPAPAFPFPETVRAGILISLFGFVNAAFQPLAGGLIDRVNRRKPFVLGCVLFGTPLLPRGPDVAGRCLDCASLRAGDSGCPGGIANQEISYDRTINL